MKLAHLCLATALTLAIAASGQTTTKPQAPTAPGAASAAQVPVRQVNNLKIATWAASSAACDQWLYRGMVFKKMASNGLVITAMLDDFDASLGAMVRIQNVRATRVQFDPAGAVVFEVKPKSKMLRYVPATELAHSIAKRAAWAAALTAAAGAFSSSPEVSHESGTYDGTTADGQSVSGDYDGTVVSQEPDREAQSRTDRRLQEIKSRSASAEKQLIAGAILPTTLFPGASLQGMIYFKRAKHVKLAVLDIEIEGVVYSFPFVYR